MWRTNGSGPEKWPSRGHRQDRNARGRARPDGARHGCGLEVYRPYVVLPASARAPRRGMGAAFGGRMKHLLATTAAPARTTGAATLSSSTSFRLGSSRPRTPSSPTRRTPRRTWSSSVRRSTARSPTCRSTAPATSRAGGPSAPRASTSSHASTSFATTSCAVGNCNNGRHEIHSKNPFGLTVWGWGSGETGNIGAGFYSQYVSYAYPGGANVKPINSVVVSPVVR